MKEPVSSLAGAPSATVAHPLGAYASADYGVEDDRVVFSDESGAVLRIKVLPSVDATLSEVRSSLRRDPSTAGLRGGSVRIDSGDALLDAVSMRRLVVLLRMEYGISVAGLRCTPAALQRFAEQVLQTRVRFSGGALEMALFEGPPPSLDGIEPLILAALPPPPPAPPVVEAPAAPVALVEDDVSVAIPEAAAEAPAPGDAPAAARAPLPVDPVALSQPDAAAPAVEAAVVVAAVVEAAMVDAPATAAPVAEAAPAAPAVSEVSEVSEVSVVSPPQPVEAAVGAMAPVAVSPAPTGRGRRRRKGAEPAAAVVAVSPPAVEAPVAVVSAAAPAPIDGGVAAPAAPGSLVESSPAEAVVEARAVASASDAAAAPALAADESSAELPTGPAAASVAARSAEAPVADAPPALAAAAAPAPLGPTSLALAVSSAPPVVEVDDPRRPGELQPAWTREGDRRVLAISRTLRSGAIIRFAGDVVVYGDVNAGAHIEAGGNIVVLGSLRGLAHAGAQGDEEAIVLGFDLKPAQLRIADHIAFPLDSAAPRAGGLLSLFSRDRLAKGGFSPVVALLREGRIVLEDYRGRLPG